MKNWTLKDKFFILVRALNNFPPPQFSKKNPYLTHEHN